MPKKTWIAIARGKANHVEEISINSRPFFSHVSPPVPLSLSLSQTSLSDGDCVTLSSYGREEEQEEGNFLRKTERAENP